MIYHITTQSDWNAAQQSGAYTAASLASEGFIHCSTAAQVVKVGNAFYRNTPNCVLLCLDETRLTAPLKWEAPAHPDPNNPPPVEAQELFPHVYGTINVDAVVRVVAFNLGADGLYVLPDIQ
jgi:uncharacterized protein (DUF952 family)